jgi:Fe-S-cluster containining protein
MELDLLAGLEAGFREVEKKAGAWLKCGPGCCECCLGPFPITRLDVRRLQKGWHDLRARDARRAGEIHRRAIRAVATLEDGFPGDFATGRPVEDERALDRFFARHASLPCPALDPDTERCDLYEARPVACRTYGPPIAFGATFALPCRLCFRGAGADTLRRCRLEPDPEGREEAILARMGIAAGEEWETLIAFALAAPAAC